MILNKGLGVWKGCLIFAIMVICITGCQFIPGYKSSESLDGSSAEQKEEPVQKELLPQTERLSGEEKKEQQNQEKSTHPFMGPLKLAGVLISDNGDNLAIIEGSSTSYIVAKGDAVAGYWNVENIDEASVLLKVDDRELILELP